MAKQYYIVILALLLTSCASAITLSNTEDLPQSEALVFGRVQFFWKGESFRFGHGSDLVQMSLFLLPPPDSEPIRYNLTGDGSFYWHLPAGDYAITDVSWNRLGLFAVRRRRLVPHFVIPEDSWLVYIGTLMVIFDGQRYVMRIEDEYAQALKGLKGRFPEIRDEASKRLMHVEKGR